MDGMFNLKINIVLLLVAVAVVTGWTGHLPIAAAASPTENDVNLVATWLYDTQDQSSGSLSEGSWSPYGDYTGSMVIGLVEAYRRTCNNDFKASALLGGDFILAQNSSPPLVFLGYGDDALAFARLSSISDNPLDNQWRSDLATFYQFVKDSVQAPPSGYGSTTGFISHFYAGTEPSTAVFYLAHHAVAAYYVNAWDKEVWRNAVIAFLSQVDDDVADYPVLALGVATWALAKTGPLSDTNVKLPGLGEEIWDGVELSDLPDLLLSHQKSSDPNAGSFFWRFDHTNSVGGVGTDDTHGYTEDNIFGVLGLAAALKADPDRSNAAQIADGIAATKSLLPRAIDPDGSVWGHLWAGSRKRPFYGGRLLTAFSGITVDGDNDMDGVINMVDYAIFAQYLNNECGCIGDHNEDGIVNLDDLVMGLAENWLSGATP